MREIRTSGSMRGRPVVLFGIAGRSTLLKRSPWLVFFGDDSSFRKPRCGAGC